MTRRAAAVLVIVAAAAFAMRTAPAGSGGTVRIVIAPGTPRAVTVIAEIAASPELRNQGLGGRQHLAPDAGMLFVYPSESERLFWMKDCVIALDVAFIGADRRILNVATLGPGKGLPDSAVPRARSASAALYVLELSAGWFAAHSAGAGDEVSFLAAVDGLAVR